MQIRFRNLKTKAGELDAVRNARADLVPSSYIRQSWGQWEWPLTISSPERAILELLNEVPQRETFHQADVLMEGLSNLSPAAASHAARCLPQRKGEAPVPVVCRAPQPRMVKKPQPQAASTWGSGKRMLVKGGKFDPSSTSLYRSLSMPVDEIYRRQATLLVRAIPLVAAETCFALKGGTAINLFVRNMPRLSVDIDLTYLPIADRAASLKEIDAAMRRIADAISRGIPGARVEPEQAKRRELHHEADRAGRRCSDQDRGHAGAAGMRL